jgi:5-methylcytosine-specific restriction endonuclease McrA
MYDAEYHRKYRETHREARVALARSYYAEHRLALLEEKKSYYTANRDAILEYKQAYRAKHRDEKAEYMRAYSVANRETLTRQANARYHTEQGRALSFANGHRRAFRKKNAPGANYITAEHIAARHEYWGHRCWVCGKAETKTKRLQTDHVKPLSKGGALWPCNVRPICGSCNSKKGSQWPYDARGRQCRE